MKKSICTSALWAILSLMTGCADAQTPPDDGESVNPPLDSSAVATVYMFNEISSGNIVKIYEALGREASGKVAVKLSTGEPGGHNFLDPNLIKDFVQKVNGTIVECNTAYGGRRGNTESHRRAAEDHGFTAIAPVDIMDAEGETELPLTGGKHLNRDIVGSHYLNYDFTIILPTSKVMRWAVSVGQSRTCPSGLRRLTANVTYIRQEQVPRVGEAPHKTIFWNQWPKPQKPLPTTVETTSFISA